MNTSFDFTTLRQQFVRDGAVVLPDFFAAAEMEPLSAEVDRYYAGKTGRTLPGFDQFECATIPWSPLDEKNAAFVDLLNHARLAEATRQIVGDGYTDRSCLVQLSHRGTGQAWHQDTLADNPERYIVNRLIYLRDVELADGALVFVPGSHRRGRIPPGGNQEPIDGEVHLTPRAGTLVFVHSHCYHRVTLNSSNRPRVSVNYRVFPAGVGPADIDPVGVYRGGAYDFAKMAVVPDKN